jgi:hypothetical protein
MTIERVIPILPCLNIRDTLDFYTALGFTVTCEQTKPNMYACVQYSGIQLHFYVNKTLNPQVPQGYCYISVPDVDALYNAFQAGIRARYGKLLKRGIPRVTSVNTLTTDRRFSVIDLGGNYLYIGQPLDTLKPSESVLDTQLAKVIMGVKLLAYRKGAPDEAAQHLDAALVKHSSAPTSARFQALALRADIAVMLGDHPKAAQLLKKLRRMELTSAERALVADEWHKLTELEELLDEK